MKPKRNQEKSLLGFQVPLQTVCPREEKKNKQNKNKLQWQQCATMRAEHPIYLSGAVEPMLCCKLVRLILSVLAQLDQKMVRGSSSRSLRREQQQQQRVQRHHRPHARPVPGRSTHRVGRCVDPSRLPDRRSGFRVRAASSLKMWEEEWGSVGGERRGGEEVGEDANGWVGGWSNQSLCGRISSPSADETAGSC